MLLIALNNIPSKKSFSLVEVLMTTGIVALLMTVLIYSFRNNLISWKRGNVKMQNQASVSLLTKRLYTDLKNINPTIYFDPNFHLWFQGEQMGDLFPNLVKLIDLDGNKQNGFEKIEINQSSIREIGTDGKPKFTLVSYSWEGKTLTRYEGEKKKVVQEGVKEFRFFKNPTNPKHLTLKIEIELKADEGKTPINEALDMNFNLDTDLVFIDEGTTG